MYFGSFFCVCVQKKCDCVKRKNRIHFSVRGVWLSVVCCVVEMHVV